MINITPELEKMVLERARECGIGKKVVKCILYSNYDDYIQSIYDDIKHAKDEGQYDPSMAENLTLTREEFDDILKNANEFIAECSKLLEKEDGDTEFKIPYREIFNGNFTKLDKSKLTHEQKVTLNVDGLLDESYDIYYNSEFKRAVPIYYDLSSSNEYFVAFSFYLEKLFESLKIKYNHKLPLIVFDRSLLGVDIRKGGLSKEIQIAAARECEINLIYAIREALTFKSKNSDASTPYQMTIGTWTVLWLYIQGFNVFRSGSRQIGKTQDLTMICGVEWGCGSKDAMIISVHFKHEDAAKNRRMMVESANSLPEFLKFQNIKKRIKNKQQIFEVGPDYEAADKSDSINMWKNNYIRVATTGTNRTTAERVGRGYSVRIAFWDEVNFTSHSMTASTALQFAHGTARAQAEKSGYRCGLLYTSTAGDLTTKAGREMYNMIFNDMAQWDIKLFGLNFEEMNDYIKKSQMSFIHVAYNSSEIGMNEEWTDRMIAQSSKRESFMVETKMMWLNTSTDSLFSVKHLGRIKNISENNLTSLYMYDKYYRITYHPRKAGMSFEDTIRDLRFISIGMDIAYGNGENADSSVLFAVDMETATPVFVYKTNHEYVDTFSHITIKLTKFLKSINPDLNIILVPETDGPGQVAIPILTRDPFVKSCLFRKRYISTESNPVLKSTTKVVSKDIVTEYGITQRKHRDYLVNKLLFELVDKYPYTMGNTDLVLEIGTLYKKTTGKIEHKPGFHDDMVMASLLAYSVIFNPSFRREIERDFGFLVDFTKIETSSLYSTVKDEVVKDHTAVDGEFTYEVIPVRKNGYEWDEIRAFVVERGIRRELTTEEVDYELRLGRLKDIDTLHYIRVRPIESFNITSKNNSLSMTKNKNGRELSFDRTQIKSSTYRTKNLMNPNAKLC